jgi:hypothetical protein
MFGDGKIKVIEGEDGELYINMWELTGHLLASAEMLEEVSGNVSEVSGTMRILVATLCDLAMFELGINSLDKVDDVETMITLWNDYRE